MSSNFIALPKLVGHRIAAGEHDPIEAALYEYFLAGNGLFLRAERREFSVSLPLSLQKVSGLPNASIGVSWKRPRICESLWRGILQHARNKDASAEFKEEVYLIYWDNVLAAWQWKAAGRNSSSMATIADDSLPEYSECCIELHTHPPGANQFSAADDRDERGKFRIFAILIDVHDKPKIRFRCGVYEHLVPIPAVWVGKMPDGIIDLNEIDALVEMLS
ncbi:MAG: Mov34/MPN/PAD-1 family protein [Pyrinomonadaceae bacterium]